MLGLGIADWLSSARFLRVGALLTALCWIVQCCSFVTQAQARALSPSPDVAAGRRPPGLRGRRRARMPCRSPVAQRLLGCLCRRRRVDGSSLLDPRFEIARSTAVRSAMPAPASTLLSASSITRCSTARSSAVEYFGLAAIADTRRPSRRRMTSCRRSSPPGSARVTMSAPARNRSTKDSISVRLAPWRAAAATARTASRRSNDDCCAVIPSVESSRVRRLSGIPRRRPA
jgi:hypothetical protein